MRTPLPAISADSFTRPAWYHRAGRNWRDVVLCPHLRLDYTEAKALAALSPSVYCEQCKAWLPIIKEPEPGPEQLSLDIDTDPAPF